MVQVKIFIVNLSVGDETFFAGFIRGCAFFASFPSAGFFFAQSCSNAVSLLSPFPFLCGVSSLSHSLTHSHTHSLSACGKLPFAGAFFRSCWLREKEREHKGSRTS